MRAGAHALVLEEMTIAGELFAVHRDGVVAIAAMEANAEGLKLDSVGLFRVAAGFFDLADHRRIHEHHPFRQSWRAPAPRGRVPVMRSAAESTGAAKCS